MSQVQEGVIHEISDIQVMSDKFQKREFVICIETNVNGNDYTDYGKFQLTQSKVGLLDSWSKGDRVRVHYNIKGNSYIDKKDGKTKFITNLDAWKLEGMQQAYTQNGGGYVANQPAQPLNQGIPVHASNHTTNGGTGQLAQPTTNYNPSPELIDDLPF
jgi:hypothetical protein